MEHPVHCGIFEFLAEFNDHFRRACVVVDQLFRRHFIFLCIQNQKHRTRRFEGFQYIIFSLKKNHN